MFCRKNAWKDIEEREKKNAEPNGRNIERIYLNVHSDCIRNMSATGSKIFFHSEYNFFLFIFVELFELVAVAHPIRFFLFISLFHSLPLKPFFSLGSASFHLGSKFSVSFVLNYGMPVRFYAL